ncbi:phospholipase D-like domain-containing protein [Ruegeria sp. Ofav3-42]|uniref:phospholipase D-like domain-containing protein n=1 Tax=Ruegeria sp. Ofav3-42 TaxID=2917759 RepID=UPI001EF587CC|nr:phospholipase D-like domain-containing protein [Ruegeria sp. Ofav3-42]MCG7519490.1 phospholipase D-like domain-containing protein [Ruegeria sp. Ofav3-42]
MTKPQNIRHAATACLPYAVAAIDLLDVMIRYAGRHIVLESLAERTAGKSKSRTEILALKQILVSYGVISRNDQAQEVLWPEESLASLRWAIEGARIGLRSAQSASEPVSVITLPNNEYDIAQSIRRRGVERATLGRTIDAFLKVARDAKNDFFVATPFIDATGVDTLNEIVKAVPIGSKCHLIVRTYDSILKAEAHGLGRSLSPRFSVFTYCRELPSGKRETFHGKYFVGDDTRAYIGSANLLQASLESTIETGVLLSGVDAKPWSVFAQAMLQSTTIVRQASSVTDL